MTGLLNLAASTLPLNETRLNENSARTGLLARSEGNRNITSDASINGNISNDAIEPVSPQSAAFTGFVNGRSTGDSLLSLQELGGLATGATGEADASGSSASGPNELTEEEEAQVRELRETDARVRAHEQAHKAAGGSYTGPISYTYQTGPDGKQYAVAGEVPIDTSPVPGNADATIQKLETVIRAALAPSDPSPQDLRVAQQAQAQLAEARQEAREEREAEFAERTGLGDPNSSSELNSETPNSNADPGSQEGPSASNPVENIQSIIENSIDSALDQAGVFDQSDPNIAGPGQQRTADERNSSFQENGSSDDFTDEIIRTIQSVDISI